MSSIFFDALSEACSLIINGDQALWEVILLSLKVSLSALVCALFIGLPLALGMAVYAFPGRHLVHILIDSFMALPPVVVGLTVYLLLSKSGPLGVWGLLYTPTAMIIAQTLLITPIVIALSLQVFRVHWSHLREQLLMLGYRPLHCFTLLLHEARTGLTTVALAAFGRAIAEIGAVMIVGGNIEHHTRVMTTSIAMETRQGNLTIALALGIILISIALSLNATIHYFSHSQTSHFP